MQVYSDPSRENEPTALPDIETFYIDESDVENAESDTWLYDCAKEVEDPNDLVGWYYWTCFPGCLPDSAPTGPFETEAEAIADAQEE